MGECGESWRVSFSMKKTQAMVILWLRPASPPVSGRLCYADQTLPLQEHVTVLGETVDCGLGLYPLLLFLPRLLACLCPALHGGAEKDQFPGHPHTVQGPGAALHWMSSDATHLQVLDVVQRSALPMVWTDGK